MTLWELLDKHPMWAPFFMFYSAVMTVLIGAALNPARKKEPKE